MHITALLYLFSLYKDNFQKDNNLNQLTFIFNLYNNWSVKMTTYCFTRCMQDYLLTVHKTSWRPCRLRSNLTVMRFSSLHAQLSSLAASSSFTLYWQVSIFLSIPLAKTWLSVCPQFSFQSSFSVNVSIYVTHTSFTCYLTVFATINCMPSLVTPLLLQRWKLITSSLLCCLFQGLRSMGSKTHIHTTEWQTFVHILKHVSRYKLTPYGHTCTHTYNI